MPTTTLNALEQARLELLQKNVLFGSLSMRLPILVDNNPRSCPTAYTNGKVIAYNQKFVDGLTSEERVGLLAHEVLHCMFLHFCRRFDREIRKWNYATDYVINYILVQQGFKLPANVLLNDQYGKLSSEEVYDVLAQKDEQKKEQDQKDGKDKGQNSDKKEGSNQEESGKDDSKKDSSNEGSEGSDEEESGNEGEGSGDEDSDEDGEGSGEGDSDEEGESGEGTGGEGDEAEGSPSSSEKGGKGGKGNSTDKKGDEEAKSGADEKEEDHSDATTFGEVRDGAADEAEAAKLEDEWKVATSTALAQFPKIGKSLGNAITDLLKQERRTNLRWEDLLADFINTYNKDDYNWMRPSRRSNGDYITPSLHNPSIRNFVVAIDTSGSVADQQLAAFGAEISEILRLNSNLTLTVIHVDTAVRHVEEFTSADSPIEFKAYGRGGTSLGCVFKHIEDNNIECEGLIFFTDLANCDWGNQPEYPVLWLHSTPYDHSYHNWSPPFGEIVPMLDRYVK